MANIVLIFISFIGMLFASRAVVAENTDRIASIDFCADQYLLALTENRRIAGVSEDAVGDRSMFREKARDLKIVSANLEELLLLDPAYVLRSWRGSSRGDTLLKKAGIEAIQPPYAATFEAAIENFEKVGELIGERANGAKLRAIYSQRLKELQQLSSYGLKAVYVTPSGFTAGTETYVSKMIELAGFKSYVADYGLQYWAPLSLEHIANNKPDVVIASFFGDADVHISHWSSGRHPIYRRLMADIPTIHLPSRYFSCGSTFAVDAVEDIRKQAKLLGLKTEGESR